MSARVSSTILLALALAAPARGETLDFMVPGLRVDGLRFEVGSWARYVSGSEAEGVADSSLVTVAVVERGEGDLYWVEFLSRPLGVEPGRDPFRAPEEGKGLGVRFLISERAVDAATPEELWDHVHRVVIRRGSEPPRERAPEELEDEKLVPVMERVDGGETRELGVDTLTVDGRRLPCRHRVVVTETRKEIPLGRGTLTRSERVEAHTWISEAVPFWGLAESRVSTRSSATATGGRPFPGLGVKETLTWARLIGFGGDRGPTIPLPEDLSGGSP
jgi:hypothetical protein